MEEITLKLPGANSYTIQEAYKVFRTNLQFCGQDTRVIALTSCFENEGKTVVSLSLAKSLAELGKRVLLIDADMRKSVMAMRNSTAKNPAGLSEVLTGINTVSECVCKTPQSNLNILFAGKYPPNPVELLSGKYFAALLSESRKVYDYVIIDTPPLGQVIDAAVIACQCDGVVLVIGNDKLGSKQAKAVVEQLKKSDCRILGAVRNKVNRDRRSYYYKGRYKGYYRKNYYYARPYGTGREGTATEKSGDTADKDKTE